MPKRLRRWFLALAATSTLIVPAVAVLPAAGAAAASCGQPAKAWWVTPGGSIGGGGTLTVPAGTPAWMTGIAMPGTSIYYFTTSGFLYAYGQLTTNVVTTAADGNCVVHHGDNQIYIPPQSGLPVVLYATYQNWDGGGWVTTYVGQINVL